MAIPNKPMDDRGRKRHRVELASDYRRRAGFVRLRQGRVGRRRGSRRRGWTHFTTHRHHVSSSGEAPETHVVRRGDTLWAVCDRYFNNPYQWPRIWSYNPQIKNPNWIYPGDELRLRIASAVPEGKPAVDAKGLSLVDRRRTVPHDSVFLRDQGWIQGDESDDVWGEVSGSASETMFLSDLNEVYLTLRSGHDPRVGQELTVFRTRSTAAAGEDRRQLLGTVRIDGWNSKERVARAQIVETLDTIERGNKVGPIARSFIVVSPVTNESDVTAHVIASLRPNEISARTRLSSSTRARRPAYNRATGSSFSVGATPGVRHSSPRARATEYRRTTSTRCRRWK